MLLVAVFIPVLNASAKYLTPNYPIMQIVWARYAGHFIFMVLFFAPRIGPSLLVSSRPLQQLA
ncbi:MAG: hypothetical protein QOH06_985, partial [Acidobacteriota bacterium]|nr:hypothetical protein [Acidobacteriota bacterium]